MEISELMSEDVDMPVRASVKRGIPPFAAIILIVLGVVFIIPSLSNIAYIGVAIFAIILISIGAFGPLGYYSFIRLPDGLRYQRRYKTFFFPYAEIQNILWDFKPIRAVHSYRNGFYVGSTAHALVRIVMVHFVGDVPIEVNTSVGFNKNRVAPDRRSLEVKISELRDKWMQVLSQPAPSPFPAWEQ